MRDVQDRIQDPITFIPLIIEALIAPTTGQMSPALRDIVTKLSGIRRDLLVDATKINLPSFSYGGRHDVFVDSQPNAVQQHRRAHLAEEAVDGRHLPRHHRGRYGRDGRPPRLDALQRAWFDKWLKGIDNGIDRYSPAVAASQGTDKFYAGNQLP